MYLFLAIIILLLSGYWFRQAAGTISIYKPNMMSWIYYYEFILLTLIGAVLVVYQVDHHYMINKLTDENSRVIGFYAILYTLVFFPLGMKLANFLFHEKRVDLLFERYTTSIIVAFEWNFCLFGYICPLYVGRYPSAEIFQTIGVF